jgi:hypothetical protein
MTQDCVLSLGVSSSVCVGGVCQEACTAGQFQPCGPGLDCVQTSAGSTCQVMRR